MSVVHRVSKRTNEQSHSERENLLHVWIIKSSVAYANYLFRIERITGGFATSLSHNTISQSSKARRFGKVAQPFSSVQQKKKMPTFYLLVLFLELSGRCGGSSLTAGVMRKKRNNGYPERTHSEGASRWALAGPYENLIFGGENESPPNKQCSSPKGDIEKERHNGVEPILRVTNWQVVHTSFPFFPVRHLCARALRKKMQQRHFLQRAHTL